MGSAEDREAILVQVVRVSRGLPWRAPVAIGVTRGGTVISFRPRAARRLGRSVASGNLILYEIARGQTFRTVADLGPDWTRDDLDRVL